PNYLTRTQDKQKGARGFRTPSAQADCYPGRENAAQAAFCCLASSRFTLRARGLSLASVVLSSQLSSPPTCSTERRACVETRNLKLRSSASDISVTFCRLGR